MSSKSQSKKKTVDVIVVGAGAAGIGVGIVLKKLGVDFIILDKNSVGSSFKKWPKETRFISPSFTGNFFKMPDLNAISPGSSPAFSLLTEHPSGHGFAQYLEGISEYYELPIQTGVEVKAVEKNKKSFILDTSKGEYASSYVIWAAGEFQYPKKSSFKGADLCVHYADVNSFAKLQGGSRIVIGGYESGFDSAVNLIRAGKKVTILDSANFMGLVNSDSSYSLSPFTRDRIRSVFDKIDYRKKTKVKEVTFEKGMYHVKVSKFKKFTSKYKPIDCTGFASSLSLVKDLFTFEEGYPLLSDVDESVKTKGLFLVGPQVKHSNALFCFIYKYRQRFAIVAEELAKRKKVPRKIVNEALEEYKENNFYLDDLSCCEDECEC